MTERERIEHERRILGEFTNPGALEEGTPATHEYNWKAAREALDRLFEAARPTQPESVGALPYPAVVALNIRQSRARLNLTQEDLAEQMRTLGFDWKRITVAEVERQNAPRRLSYDELIGLAVVLLRPVASLLCSYGQPVMIEELGWTFKPELFNILVVGWNAQVDYDLDKEAVHVAFTSMNEENAHR